MLIPGTFMNGCIWVSKAFMPAGNYAIMQKFAKVQHGQVMQTHHLFSKSSLATLQRYPTKTRDPEIIQENALAFQYIMAESCQWVSWPFTMFSHPCAIPLHSHQVVDI